MQCSLSDQSWCQATLPFRFGGLGLFESVFSAFWVLATVIDSYYLCRDLP